MFDNQMSMFDQPATIEGLCVEKIYVTRGKNTVNWDGDICDRYCGLVIGGKTHWIDKTFAHISELHNDLKSANVFIVDSGAWGTIKEDGSGTTWIDNKVVKLKQGETELFGSDSSHMAKSERMTDGRIWWTIDNIKARYFTKEVA